MASLQKGFWMMIELVLRLVIHPRLRALLLGMLGATIGRNVRVYEGHFMNLEQGFTNLSLADDVHLGPNYTIDLKGQLIVGKGSTISPRVAIMTHADPGITHGSPVCEFFPVKTGIVKIGENCWIGAGAILLEGAELGDGIVVGAGGVVRTHLSEPGVYVGVPVHMVRALQFTSAH